MSLNNFATIARLDRLTLAIGEDCFGASLIETARAVGDVDHVIIYALVPGQLPRVVINVGCIDPVVASAAAAAYATKLFPVDPHREEICQQSEGPATWFKFADAEFADAKFAEDGIFEAFRVQYLGPCGISDILSFAVCQGSVIYLVQFLRTDQQHFASAQCWLLQQIGEILAAHVRKHFSYRHAIKGNNQFLIARVLSESLAFTKISPRERLVCIGVLTGHTSESIARNLSISINSVLTYRRRLYEKLGISSQNELFVRVIDAMMILSKNSDNDEAMPRRNGRPLAADLAFAEAFLA